MKQLGRAHRHYYRICAMDHRSPRDGRAIEELGTYDPSVPDTDQRVTLKASRIKYWLSVGAKPSEHVEIFLKKYLEKWEKIEAGELEVEARKPRVIPQGQAPKQPEPEPEPEAPAEEAAAEGESSEGEAPAEGDAPAEEEKSE